MTYKWFIEETERQLAHLYPTQEGRAIAVRLLQRFCGISPYEHLVEPYGAIAAEYLSVLESAVLQLAVARPLQYVIGVQEFLGRELFVEEGVLIPRPETEELVLWVLEYVKQVNSAEKSKFGMNNIGREADDNIGECELGNDERNVKNVDDDSQRISIIDACCGSGAIAVSLAASLPSAEIYAFDISEKALEVTSRNCKALLPDSPRVELFKFDLLNASDSILYENHSILESDSDWDNRVASNNVCHISEQVDIIVSNPPYVTNSERADMRKNVLDYEPEEALFVPDDDQLIFYKALERFSTQYLKPGGSIFLEINERFGSEVAAIFREAGYGKVIIKQDIFAKDRMVYARL